MRSVKHSRKLAIATALLLWQKCLKFRGAKKPFTIEFTILNAHVCALVSYSFSFDLSLRWPLLLSMAALKGHAQFKLTQRVLRLPASRNIHTSIHIMIFPDATIVA